MSGRNVKKLTTNFSNNLQSFNKILEKIEQHPDSDIKEIQNLDAARKKIVTSAREYFNYLGMNPKIIQLISPLMRGELEHVDQETAMKKIQNFSENLKKITKEINSDLETNNEADLLDKYCTLQGSKDVPDLKHKIKAIQNKFIEQLRKANTQNGNSGGVL